MALTTKSPTPVQQKRAARRIWNAPVTRARWFWLACALVLSCGIASLYLFALQTQPFPGPFSDPLRSFGIVAFVLVLGTAAYGLRRRFARNLPGKVQGWLWMHVWIGCAALLVAFLHENFARILNDYCQNADCLTSSYGGTSALFALILLVFSGLIGRLLDRWQVRVVAREASINGAGIIQASEEQLLELEYTLERLCAGKSAVFKEYCLLNLAKPQRQEKIPTLRPDEQGDFQRACDALLAYSRLARSLRRQKRACLTMRVWRTLHRALAVLALLIIVFHASMELLIHVLHIIHPT